MSTANGLGMEAKETGLERRPSGTMARGEETPSEPEPSGGDNEEKDEHEEEGEVAAGAMPPVVFPSSPPPPPHSPLPEDLPVLGDIFSWHVGISNGAGMWASLSGRVGQTGPGWRPGHRLAHRCNFALH
jgi:hypothetical protein